MSTVFALTVDAPASGKNRQRIVSFGPKCPQCKRRAPSIRKSKEADADEKSIRLRANVHARFPDTPIFGDDDVSVLITHNAIADTIDVEVRSLGPRPSGFSGRKRDLHNLTDVLLDALQGIVFENDNQVRRIALARRIDR